MEKVRTSLIQIIEQGHLPCEKIPQALIVTQVIPSGSAWLRFIDNLLLWIGSLAMASAVLFFIAYNWDDIGRFAKFGMVEALMVGTLLAYWKLDEAQISAKVALLMASIFLGVLLALFGQTYQTGADTWELFFNWALLMLPWTIIARFPALWILWMTLVNLAIVQYYRIFPGPFGFIVFSGPGMFWVLFGFNTAALASWEILSNRWHWLNERWAARLLATGSGISITWLTMQEIFDHREGGVSAALVWLIWIAAFYWIYRQIKHDLFMLAGAAFSVIIIVTCFINKSGGNDAGVYLFSGFLIIGMGAGAAIWLRNIHREWQS